MFCAAKIIINSEITRKIIRNSYKLLKIIVRRETAQNCVFCGRKTLFSQAENGVFL